MKKVHMIGIKGSGMSALAIILKRKGYKVQGSDNTNYIFTENNLKENNIKILNFKKENIKDCDFIICGNSFQDNIEMKEAQLLGKKIFTYTEYLKKISEENFSIAIAGTHGKTTTTALVSKIFEEIGCNYLIGDGSSDYKQENNYFIFEACEYKNNFLNYFPNIAIINNIELDHVDFFKSIDDYLISFQNFAYNVKDFLIINGDDLNLKKIKANCKKISFGLNNDNDIYATNIKTNENGIEFELFYLFDYLYTFKLPFYGIHSIYNSLAAISVGIINNIPLENIANQLLKFKGVKRRFSEIISYDDIYIDDYAHHPSAIEATIKAVKQRFNDKQVVAIFKPDRCSRFNHFLEDFSNSLSYADSIFICDFPNFIEKDAKSHIEDIKKFNNNINLLINEEDYYKLAEIKDSIYLFMSSKDFTKEIKKLEKIRVELTKKHFLL